MWDTFVGCLVFLMFIDLVRWGINSDNKPNIILWMFNSLWQNAIWIVIFMAIYKVLVWVFS